MTEALTDSIVPILQGIAAELSVALQSQNPA